MGTSRILVMDDEEIIQDVLSTMLDFLGYEAHVVSDGAEAIDRYSKAMESGEPFAAVIIDLTIPGGMGGKEAVHHLRAIDPNVRVIVSSGYSSDPAVTNYRDHGFSAAISKPFKLEDLKKAVQEVFR
jgi:two-component system cell cycle sensor histidine kinase/response regulator CckA